MYSVGWMFPWDHLLQTRLWPPRPSACARWSCRSVPRGRQYCHTAAMPRTWGRRAGGLASTRALWPRHPPRAWCHSWPQWRKHCRDHGGVSANLTDTNQTQQQCFESTMGCTVGWVTDRHQSNSATVVWVYYGLYSRLSDWILVRLPYFCWTLCVSPSPQWALSTAVLSIVWSC
jgi:hypothetical protein